MEIKCKSVLMKLTLVLLVVVLTACSNGEDNKEEKVDKNKDMLFIDMDEGKCIFLNEYNEVVEIEGYESVISFKDGVGVAKSGNKQCLIDTEGNLISEKYDKIENMIGAWGYFKVTNGNLKGVINKKGEVIVELEYDDIISDFASFKVFKYIKGNEQGYMDYNGELIIKADEGFTINLMDKTYGKHNNEGNVFTFQSLNATTKQRSSITIDVKSKKTIYQDKDSWYSVYRDDIFYVDNSLIKLDDENKVEKTVIASSMSTIDDKYSLITYGNGKADAIVDNDLNVIVENTVGNNNYPIVFKNSKGKYFFAIQDVSNFKVYNEKKKLVFTKEGVICKELYEELKTNKGDLIGLVSSYDTYEVVNLKGEIKLDEGIETMSNFYNSNTLQINDSDIFLGDKLYTEDDDSLMIYDLFYDKKDNSFVYYQNALESGYLLDSKGNKVVEDIKDIIEVDRGLLNIIYSNGEQALYDLDKKEILFEIDDADYLSFMVPYEAVVVNFETIMDYDGNVLYEYDYGLD